MRVQIAVAEQITFGPQLQIAKAGIDELLLEWGEQSPPEMLAIVTNAPFAPTSPATSAPGRLLGLKRIDIEDERWVLRHEGDHRLDQGRGVQALRALPQACDRSDEAWVAHPHEPVGRLMSCDVFLTRHARTGQTLGLVACGRRGAISLYAVSRDTLNVTLLERGRPPTRRALSRRGPDLLLVIAALTASSSALPSTRRPLVHHPARLASVEHGPIGRIGEHHV